MSLWHFLNPDHQDGFQSIAITLLAEQSVLWGDLPQRSRGATLALGKFPGCWSRIFIGEAFPFRVSILPLLPVRFLLSQLADLHEGFNSLKDENSSHCWVEAGLGAQTEKSNLLFEDTFSCLDRPDQSMISVPPVDNNNHYAFLTQWVGEVS